MTRSDIGDIAAAAVTAALLIAVGLGQAVPGRAVLALAFMTFVPGWVLLDYVNLADDAARPALAVALSLSLSIVATSTVLWLHVWNARGLLDGSGAVCLAAAIAHLARTPEPRRNA